MISGAPQVIRRGDSYALLNVDLEPLSQRERVVLAVQIVGQVMHLVKENGEFINARQVQTEAARLTGATATSTVIKMCEMVNSKPELLDLYRDGMSLADVRRAGGYRFRGKIAEGKVGKSKTLGNFGTSDKFVVVFEVMWKYLKAQEKRDFKYTHINPSEAKKRLKRINEVRELLDKAAEDIERRSHSVTSRAPSKKRRRENGV